MYYRKFSSIFLVCCFLISSFTFTQRVATAATQHEDISVSSAQQLLHSQTDFFTENKGQWNEEIQFIGNTSFGKVAFTKEAVYYQLTRSELTLSIESTHILDPITQMNQLENRKTETQTIKLSFVNGQEPKIIGENVLPHYNNYFIGNDPAKWASYCKNYAKVYYEDIWEGIDLAYFFTPEGMKYEYYVEPNADIHQLQIKVEGAELSHQEDSLEFRTQLGKIQDTQLKVFDQATHSPIPAEFAMKNNTYSFQGIAELRKNVMVIDPLIYSTYLGGNDLDVVMDIKVDASGNAYVVGHTDSPDFSVTPGAFMTSFGGGTDGFVTKLNPTGSALIYSTYLGGSGGEIISNMAIDTNGNSYLIGYSGSNNFPTTPGAFMTSLGGVADGFITKLNPTGSALIYSTYLGGIGFDQIGGISVDTAGNAYVNGHTESINFPVTVGAFQTFLNGPQDCFITKLNPTGSALIYSTFLGGNGHDLNNINCIYVDSNGNAFLIGYTGSPDFPVTPGAFMTSPGGGIDGFVTKLNPTGSALIYSTFLGGNDQENISCITVDALGYAYVAGYTHSLDYPTTPGAFMTAHGGGWDDSFITKINPNGSALEFSTYLGGYNMEDLIFDMAVDSKGNVYVTGMTNGNYFPVTPGALISTFSDQTDSFITKMNSTGSSLLYSSYLGGNAVDWGEGITLDSAGNVYIVGYTYSPDFPVTPGAFKNSAIGYLDGFVTKLSIIDVTLTGSLNVNQVDLQWALINQGSEIIKGYQIYRADVADGIYQLLTTILGAGNLTYTDSTGIPGKTYSYYVVALYGDDSPAAESNRIELGPIQSVQVTLTGFIRYNESYLNWSVYNPDNIPIYGYRIYRGIPDEFLYVIDFITGDSIHSYIDENGLIGKHYLYAVEAMATNDQSLAFSNEILLGPIQALPDPILGLSIELNKHEFCYGDDVLYKVTVHNTTAGSATVTKLQVTLPREIQYSSADQYRGQVQSGGVILFNLGTIPGNAHVTFQINATVALRTSVMTSAATLFYVSCSEDVFAETVVYTTLKSCDGGNPIPYIKAVLLNTQFDPETGERYIEQNKDLLMDVTIDGFTPPYGIEIVWGDGERDILSDQTEKTFHLKHKFTSKGVMEIRIHVADTAGKSKEVSLRIRVK